MNRIILIGNGFDLAHGLKTSYQDFIDDYWEKKINCFRNNKSNFADDDIEIVGFNPSQIYNYQKLDSISTLKEFEDFLKSNKTTIQYKNIFFETITKKSYLQNWVDIEEEYYQQLKEILQKESSYYGKTKEITAVKELNDDFEHVKNELKKYLLKVIGMNNKRITDIQQLILKNIYDVFNVQDFTSTSIIKFAEWLLKQNSRKVLFLNFNYTKTEDYYVNGGDSKIDKKNEPIVIHIHGELQKSNNSIIFGYGDEQDDMHKEIEKKGGNYLDNIKSINYLKTPNYKKMLDFIEDDSYQIFIMGHSWGLSDKTLLNTLFEHPNCVSIKPFYYIDENGHNSYDDIVKNIYRCFNDKSLMREKVVNLEYCKPLCE